MTPAQNRNAYLDQVVAQGAQLEQDLRSKRSAPAVVGLAASMAPPPPGGAPSTDRTRAAFGTADEPALHAVDVRVTGIGRWKTVVVPPNAFVVHTRRGRPEPLHVGLGVSFRYNPATDSHLVVPGGSRCRRS